MVLMIGTPELAQRLYERWRAKQDLVNPARDDRGPVRNRDHFLVEPTRDMPRPKWQHLDTTQQGVWLAVAAEACEAIAELAMAVA